LQDHAENYQVINALELPLLKKETLGTADIFKT
jgi:hypothetical protein